LDTHPWEGPDSHGRATSPSIAVLVIDDDLYFRFSLASALRAEGFSVLTAGNGRDGLRLLRSEPPDVVVLDLRMPKMSGDEFLDEKRDDAQVADIPTVVVSATGHQRHEPSENVVAVLRKPIELEHLIQVLEKTAGQDES
jgi:CheY-like chemotaxis protein